MRKHTYIPCDQDKVYASIPWKGNYYEIALPVARAELWVMLRTFPEAVPTLIYRLTKGLINTVSAMSCIKGIVAATHYIHCPQCQRRLEGYRYGWYRTKLIFREHNLDQHIHLPLEKLATLIKPGDTPFTNDVSRLLLDWISQWRYEHENT